MKFLLPFIRNVYNEVNGSHLKEHTLNESNFLNRDFSNSSSTVWAGLCSGEVPNTNCLFLTAEIKAVTKCMFTLCLAQVIPCNLNHFDVFTFSCCIWLHRLGTLIHIKSWICFPPSKLLECFHSAQFLQIKLQSFHRFCYMFKSSKLNQDFGKGWSVTKERGKS